MQVLCKACGKEHDNMLLRCPGTPVPVAKVKPVAAKAERVKSLPVTAAMDVGLAGSVGKLADALGVQSGTCPACGQKLPDIGKRRALQRERARRYRAKRKGGGQ